MPTDASRLYAKNVANLLALMTCDGTVAPDFDDDVVAGACLTHDGAVRHAPTAEALAALAGKTVPPAPAGHPAGEALPEADPPDGELAGEKASENEGVA
jgi:NAD(P) transhydrogenase subunit alpha